MLIKNGSIVANMVLTEVSIIHGIISLTKGLLFIMLNIEGIKCVLSDLSKSFCFFSFINALKRIIVEIKNIPIIRQIEIKLVSFDFSVHTTLLIFASFLTALPAGGAYINEVILTDIIDYDEFLTGKRNEAIYTVFSSFIPN